MFRSFHISIEDIKRYYEEPLSLDDFLGFQLGKQKEKINELEQNQKTMLKLQQHCNKVSLQEIYQSRREEVSSNNEKSEFEAMYLVKTKRGKQKLLITLLWLIALGISYEVAVAISSKEVLGWTILGLLILTILLSILLWFSFSFHRFFLILINLLGIIEEFPNFLDRKLENHLPWYGIRKIISLFLALILLFGVPIFLCIGIALFF